jgi:hypothetical protein
MKNFTGAQGHLGDNLHPSPRFQRQANAEGT